MIRTRQPGAFSLIEVALSLAIIATAIIAIIGILPVGVDASKRAVDSTVVAMILDSLHHRLQGEALTQNDSVSFSPALFDAQGTFVPKDADPAVLARAVYRADVKLADWQERPENTSSLRVVTITLAWPMNTREGEIVKAGRTHHATVSYPVTALTGSDWPEIARAYTADPVFVPKIGF